MTASLKNLVYSSLGPWFKFSMLPCNLGFEQSNTLPLSQKVKKYSKAISGLHSVRGGSFHRRSFFRQQICAISRYRNTNWITNVKQNIINAQNELRFFRDYHNHSKDIVKIIKSSFGRNSGILGDCKLTLGLIQIHRPKEPEIADIGPARDHLRDGYAEVWGLKAKAESDADHVLLEIEKVKINFESRIINEIERETENT